jgi:hypothetical protein
VPVDLDGNIANAPAIAAYLSTRRPGQSPISVADDAQYLGVEQAFELIEWAVREEMLNRNPAKGLRLNRTFAGARQAASVQKT